MVICGWMNLGRVLGLSKIRMLQKYRTLGEWSNGYFPYMLQQIESKWKARHYPFSLAHGPTYPLILLWIKQGGHETEVALMPWQPMDQPKPKPVNASRLQTKDNQSQTCRPTSLYVS